MERALERVTWVELRAGLRLLDIFADDVTFEQHRLALVGPHPQQRNLAERRQRDEPVRLVGEVDVDPLERDARLRERDRGALDVGTEVVADERERGHRAASARSKSGQPNIASYSMHLHIIEARKGDCQDRCSCIRLRCGWRPPF